MTALSSPIHRAPLITDQTHLNLVFRVCLAPTAVLSAWRFIRTLNQPHAPFLNTHLPTCCLRACICFCLSARKGLSVTSVALFGSLDTAEPPAAEPLDAVETMSIGGQSNEGSTYNAPVRQGPGGNSSLVLG